MAKCLLSICIICILVVVDVALGSGIRGVSPAEQQFYKGEFFKCRNEPNREIPANRINDNYCDCADGTDEPGTSACSAGIFYCENKGYQGETIFSSKVNDGICDCCDGADEHEGKVNCANTCNEKGAVLRKHAEEEKAKITKGLETKAQWIMEAAKTLQDKRGSIDNLKAEVEKLKKVADDLEAEKKGYEEKERAEQDVINERRREVERLEQERLAREAPPVPPTPESEAQEEDALKNLLENEGKEGEQTGNEVPPAAEEPAVEVPPATPPPEEETEELKSIRDGKRKVEGELSNVRRDLSSAESDLRNTEEILGRDFGPNGEFLPLNGNCYDYKTREYTYTMCPYGEVKQGHTSLGKFENWDPAHSIMSFTNGQQCWGGPKRSARISMLCGAENELYDIQEPNKCEYTMKFNTPAACQATPLEFLEHGSHHGESLPH